jgi:hypothetical protein
MEQVSHFFLQFSQLLTSLDFLYVFGISKSGSLRLQVWTGYDWQPAADDTWSLGDLSTAYIDHSDVRQEIFGADEF